MRFRGYVYRAHKPQWAWDDPLSGEGARRRGGRFNRQGTSAFYTALSLFGALREVSQPLFPLQPVLLCSYDVSVEPVFDATDASTLAAAGASAADLDCPDWERRMLGGGIPDSQQLAERLIAQGYAGMLVPSFVPVGLPQADDLSGNPGDDDRNLVLRKWSDSLPIRVRLVDDEGRLASDRSSD